MLNGGLFLRSRWTGSTATRTGYWLADIGWSRSATSAIWPGLMPHRRLNIFGLRVLQFTYAAAGMLDTMPGHLQHFGRRISGAFVRLASRHLCQIINLVRKFRFDAIQRFQKLLRMIFGILLTGLFFAQFGQRWTWMSERHKTII